MTESSAIGRIILESGMGGTRLDPMAARQAPLDPSASATAPALEGAAIDYSRALELHRRGDIAGARSLYQRVLDAQPDHAAALQMSGTAALQAGDVQDGIDRIARSIEIDPAQPAAYSALGNALRSMDRPLDAIAHYRRALELDPAHAPALNNLGSALLDLGRVPEAVDCYERALQLKPGNLGALVNHGNALMRMGEAQRAAASYQRAIQLRPDYAPALIGLAGALRELRRLDEALDVFGRYLRLDPMNFEAWHDYGGVLHELRRLEEAAKAYERALELNPLGVRSYSNLGSALSELDRHDRAAVNFAKAIELEPKFPYAIGSLLQAKLMQCDWTDWQHDVDRVVTAVNAGEPAIFPIALLVASDSPTAQLNLARAYVRMFPEQSLGQPGPPNEGRIRVAYLSADFRNHPVAQLLCGVLERHDRERFETIGVSLTGADGSELHRRIRSACDRWIDASAQSDAAVAQALREMKVDIVVDLQGFTQGMRAGILARRAAPVQVNYLGFAATMGASYIDYIIADSVVIPEGAEAGYEERVVRLPRCFLPFDDSQPIGAHIPSRAEAGLPAEGFVFCSFNNHFKITPVLFDVWMRVLRATPGSCLWLRWANPVVMGNLRREAQARGVDPQRIIFAPRTAALEDHLARQALADLFLDTLPYNAHATAAQALWAGLPVLTCLGSAFASRVAGSLLTAVGLPELISDSLDEYERLALELAADRQRLQGLRARLQQHRARAALFDTAGYCRDLESAFALMAARHRAQLPPVHLGVPDRAVADSVRPPPDEGTAGARGSNVMK